MLLLVGTALGHVPHTMVTSLVPATNLDDSDVWWVLATPYLPVLLRSDDGGASFTVVGGEPLGDWPTDMARTDSGTLVLVGGQRYWWTENGEDWDSAALPGRVNIVAAAGDRLLLGGPSGLFVVEIGGNAEQVLSTAVTSVQGGTFPTATGADGLLYTRDERGWVTLEPLAATPASVANDGVEVYAGAQDGTVWRLATEGWQACGALPGAGAEHSAVVAIALDEGRVLAGTGNAAPYISTDGCASWGSAVAPGSTDWTGTGAPEREQDVVTDLYSRGDRVAWGGWSGLWRRVEGAWLDAALLGADYTRGVALGEDPGKDYPRVYLGSYGGGVLRSDDGGRSWTGHNDAMTGSNVQDVQLGAGVVDTLYALSGHHLNVSLDGGDSTDGGNRGEKATAVSADAAGPTEVWAQFEDGLLRSTNAGSSWSSPLSTGAGGTLTRHLRVGDEVCAFFQRPFEVSCAPDPGGPWTLRFTSPAEPPSPVVGVPFDAPERVLAGLDAVLLASDDAFASTTTALSLDDDRVVAVAVADDETVVVATLSGRLLASSDRGDTWIDTGQRLPAAPWSLTARPGFAERPDVVAATPDGAYVLGDPTGDATLKRLASLQRIDDASEFWAYGAAGCPPSHNDPRGEMGTLRALDEGCVLRQWIRGTEIRLLGIPGGSATLAVDGDAPVGFGTGAGGELVELVSLTVAEGWHHVELRGMLSGILFDALEGSGDGVLLAPNPIADSYPAPEPATAPEPGTACGGCDAPAGSSAAALLVALPLVTRRRHVARMGTARSTAPAR